MDNVQAQPSILSKVLTFGLIGFFAVVFSGPLITLLVFSLIGFGVWTGVRAVCFGKDVAWQDVQSTAKMLGQKCLQAVSWLGINVGGGVRTAGNRAWHGAKHVAWVAKEKVQPKVRYVGGIVKETVSGSLVGAGLGMIAGLPTGTAEIAIPAGTIAGAFLGVMAGASHRQRSPVTFTVPSGNHQRS